MNKLNERVERLNESNDKIFWGAKTVQTHSIEETDNTKIRYWEFSIVLFPQEKVVNQVVLKLTERQMHEKSAKIAVGLDEQGMSFNGKNANHYFQLVTKELPSPEELERLIAVELSKRAS